MKLLNISQTFIIALVMITLIYGSPFNPNNPIDVVKQIEPTNGNKTKSQILFGEDFKPFLPCTFNRCPFTNPLDRPCKAICWLSGWLSRIGWMLL
jgi:hypothetical protein